MELIKLLKNKKFKSARSEVEKELKASPDNVYLLTQKANILWNLFCDTDALECADKAKAMDADYPLLMFTRGRILSSLGKYDDALSEWDCILAKNELFLSEHGFGRNWARSVLNDSRFYKAECLFHLYRDQEALDVLTEHLHNRRKGVQSDFTKQEAENFFKILKYSPQKRVPVVSDAGFTTERQGQRIHERIEKLKKSGDIEQIQKYLKGVCKRYPKEYYYKTMLAEYYRNAGDFRNSLKYAKKAFDMEPDDMLVVYNYASALHANRHNEEALLYCNVIISKGLDYIAYSEHGEGIRWARRLLRDTKRIVDEISAVYENTTE